MKKSSSSFVPDIKPIPVKERSSQGKISIFLEEGREITLVGLVYGMEHTLSGANYSAKVLLDHYSQRIRILEYSGTDFDNLILSVRALAEANNFDKIICYARKKDWQEFLKHGYVLEAVLKYYFEGEDAYVVSKFRSQERSQSPNLMEEVLMIEEIMNGPMPEKLRVLPEGYSLRLAQRDDIPELISLYQRIFESYPSPLSHQEYVHSVFEKDNLFALITKGEKIVAAASAELNHSCRSAELTDCATLPEERGGGLMSIILNYLEVQLRERDFCCAYTLSRARSFGMNRVFYHLNYEFLGRLVNNCDIYGAYEDMNLWTKALK
ncbi:MAG: putative beta-lysine N-acetyltransferase [Bdellovibrionota bacterium]